jgi:hypothetical protein
MLTYLKGPLGWAVSKDGKPIGRITHRAGVYMLSIDGFRPGVDPATRGTHTFGTLAQAKAKAEQVAAAPPSDKTDAPAVSE